MAEQWLDIARANLDAAECLFQSGESPRSVISRSYYAGFALIVHVALEHQKGKLKFSDGRQAPSHDNIPELIGNLSTFEFSRRKESKRLVRWLYNGRIDADYKADAGIDLREARKYLAGAHQLFRELGVTSDNNH